MSDKEIEEKTKEEVKTDLVAFTVISQTGLMIDQINSVIKWKK